MRYRVTTLDGQTLVGCVGLTKAEIMRQLQTECPYGQRKDRRLMPFPIKIVPER